MHAHGSTTRNNHYKLAFIVSRFNQEITEALYQGAMERVAELEICHEFVKTYWVPGAVEIPITAQHLAKSGKYEAIICLGAVIRGETSHYDYVCQQVSDGCLQVALKYDVPVIFGILTTENDEQALARVGGEHGHKGRESVDAAIEMITVLRDIDKP